MEPACPYRLLGPSKHQILDSEDLARLDFMYQRACRSYKCQKALIVLWCVAAGVALLAATDSVLWGLFYVPWSLFVGVALPRHFGHRHAISNYGSFIRALRVRYAWAGE